MRTTLNYYQLNMTAAECALNMSETSLKCFYQILMKVMKNFSNVLKLRH